MNDGTYSYDWNDAHTALMIGMMHIQLFNLKYFRYLGKQKGHKAKIHVDSKATVKYCKARPVPYAIQGKVDSELEQLRKRKSSSPYI